MRGRGKGPGGCLAAFGQCAVLVALAVLAAFAVVAAFAVARLDLTFAKLAPTPLDTPNRCTVRTRPRCPKRYILVLKRYLYVLLPRKRTKKLP